jgi:hypothetical protein
MYPCVAERLVGVAFPQKWNPCEDLSTTWFKTQVSTTPSNMMRLSPTTCVQNKNMCCVRALLCLVLRVELMLLLMSMAAAAKLPQASGMQALCSSCCAHHFVSCTKLALRA